MNSDQVVVKVVGYNSNNQWLFADDSDLPLRITKGGTVLTPTAGEAYQPGDSLNITWVDHPQGDHYVVRFSQDGGTPFWTLPGGGNVTGDSFNWTLPNWLNSDPCQVLIQTYNSSNQWIASGKSDGVFSVLKP
jgi:hypothetical protein